MGKQHRIASNAPGYAGKILRVDLTRGTTTVEDLPPVQVLRQYLGGNGLGLKFIYDEVPPGVEPYDAENRLIFASGLLSGTSIPGSGTYSIITRGPMTNLLASSQANGFFAARMRFAGFDLIIIQGTSTEWKYLWIHDGEAELRPAAHLVGLDTWETEDHIKNEVGQKRAAVACVGPAGENLVRFAAICGDHGHVASTNGCGAVMGSKKLKAIAVFGERSAVNVWDPERLRALARGEFLKGAEGVFTGATVKSVGTHGWFSPNYKIGNIAVKNYTTNVWPTIDNLYGDNIRPVFESEFERKPRPCWACPWAHCSDVKITKGPLAGYKGEEPEFETLTAWNPNVGVDDVAWAVMLHNLTDRMGMDAKECTFAISMAMECYEKGVIGSTETGGLRPTWGNAAAVAHLIEDIAHRRGFGDTLAEGVMRASASIGGSAPDCAVYYKRGIAPHILDFRGKWGSLFSLATSDGGSFWASPVQDPDVGNMEPIPLFGAEEIPRAAARSVRRNIVYDTTGVCLFFLHGPLASIVEAVRAATGWDFSKNELLEVGERMANVARSFNIRHGLDPDKDDTVSPRVASPPVDGPAKGKSVGRVLAQMKRAYYREMGWDEKTSKPLPETLHRLGLDQVAKDLSGRGE
ncbi:MAG: hypothetical protein EPO21_20715 [Chloroflexota bacterium]|nr:MAG: hypothetical protein EPO21_20715 [Chloroflexota bacterium]